MRKSNTALRNTLFRAVGALFLLTMLSLWLVCGLFARFAIEDKLSDGARVAGFGFVEVKEHEAKLKEVEDGQEVSSVYYGGEYDDMVYTLDKNSEVDSNSYSVMMPGVDIPKDPFVRIDPGEVDCELYLEVIDKDIPTYTDTNDEIQKTVTYTIDPDNWKKDTTRTGPNGGVLYKYKEAIGANSDEQEINIIKDLKLYVSQYYDADRYRNDNDPDDDSFVTFYAWIVQID